MKPGTYRSNRASSVSVVIASLCFSALLNATGDYKGLQRSRQHSLDMQESPPENGHTIGQRAMTYLQTRMFTLACVAALYSTTPVLAAELPIESVNYALQTVDKLEIQGKISHKDAEDARNEYHREANALAARTLTRFDLEHWQELQAVDMVSNTGRLLGGLAMVIAVIALATTTFWKLVSQLPPRMWERGLYLGGGGLLFATHYAVTTYLGALLFGCGLLLHTAIGQDEQWAGVQWRHLFTEDKRVLWLIATVTWAIAAYWQQDGLLAVLATLALEVLVASAASSTSVFNFDREKIVPSDTLVSLVVFGGGLAMPIGKLAVFGPPMVGIGVGVYFLGMLIVSLRWYGESNTQSYLIRQILAFGSGIAALYLGNAFNFAVVGGVGGTFLSLYTIVKYVEWVWSNKNWAWSLLGLGAILLALAQTAKVFPTYFLLHF
jgi:hypothetical protein